MIELLAKSEKRLWEHRGLKFVSKRVFEGYVLVVTERARGPLTPEERLTDLSGCAWAWKFTACRRSGIIWSYFVSDLCCVTIYSVFNVAVFLMWSFLNDADL